MTGVALWTLVVQARCDSWGMPTSFLQAAQNELLHCQLKARVPLQTVVAGGGLKGFKGMDGTMYDGFQITLP